MILSYFDLLKVLIYQLKIVKRQWKPDWSEMKKRTLSGNTGIGIFVVAFVCIAVAFCSPNWLVSDYRITGAKLDKLGLWTHCFKSLPDPQDEFQRRFFVGCRWVYDPFTTGYYEIRDFLLPRK